MTGMYENIKRLCREKHMTVFDLEKAAGLPFNTITKWGKHSPSIDKVQRAAEALDVKVDELLKGVETWDRKQEESA